MMEAGQVRAAEDAGKGQRWASSVCQEEAHPPTLLPCGVTEEMVSLAVWWEGRHRHAAGVGVGVVV